MRGWVVVALALSCGSGGSPKDLTWTQHMEGDLLEVWGSGPDDVWAIGAFGGLVVHSVDRGKSFQKIAVPTQGPFPPVLWNVGGTATDVYLVGEKGLILHSINAGMTWESEPSGTTESLRAVWARSNGDLWIAGDKGTLLHGDGQTWMPVASGTTHRLWSIWGDAQGDLYVAGGDLHLVDSDPPAGSVVLHSIDGRSFDAADPFPMGDLVVVWGTGPDEVYAAGNHGALFRTNDRGKTWPSITLPTMNGLGGVTKTSDGTLYVSGFGVLLRSNDAKQWDTLLTCDLGGVWSGSDGRIYAVGAGGVYIGSP